MSCTRDALLEEKTFSIAEVEEFVLVKLVNITI
jgi:hypothetical protein